MHNKSHNLHLILCLNYAYIFPGVGKFYSVNFPLKDGVTDEQYSERIFKPIIQATISTFKPTAIVLQCGADSLAGDRLGCFNVTSMGHGSCVDFVKGFNLPLLVLGGGGYTISSVARCWCYETACLLEADISLGKIPANEYSEYFAPDQSLFVPATGGMENQNTHGYVEKAKNKVSKREHTANFDWNTVLFSVEKAAISISQYVLVNWNLY